MMCSAIRMCRCCWCGRWRRKRKRSSVGVASGGVRASGAYPTGGQPHAGENAMSRLREWFAFARAVFTRFGEDEGPVYAASIAYYTLLSIFPLILGLVALLGFFLE